ncbi:hypothetical protein [Microtetraspora glauca]|uniref:Uncharacterized protein n=1 Tax=Microtetraspora glauca TaxID=1996 RepID=A0ABV3GRM3_MICGL
MTLRPGGCLDSTAAVKAARFDEVVQPAKPRRVIARAIAEATPARGAARQRPAL